MDEEMGIIRKKDIKLKTHKELVEKGYNWLRRAKKKKCFANVFNLLNSF